MQPNDIEKNNKTDITLSTIKSIAGPIPFVGPMIQEMFDVIVPNQRIDRLSRYVLELEKKLQQFQKEQLDNKLKSEEFVDLMEESMFQASRALSDDRIKYISSVIENSLDNNYISDLENKHLLNLLKELNDIEIIWLRFYLNPLMNSDKEFRQLHSNVLKTVIPTLGGSKEDIDKEAIQNSYKEHLATLGLLKKNISIKIGGNTNELETKGYEITSLGKLLLKQIGFKDEEWLR
ncbi:MAG: hypothetical protein PHQ90_02425 [Sulfuricurvum sp.]|uniref:hypothetical protein n=1 Tax=Sulfuricurvum sp. TaxID=2025608 RepID=UPI00261FAFDF|nr:hypothetical protein [Sulfuricurvum sp.]MDD2368128.1 hypothetical protein [Sulfuricurvum sp.]MDD5117827.1 hypothetical protein [Sulfuricurvum sp.]